MHSYVTYESTTVAILLARLSGAQIGFCASSIREVVRSVTIAPLLGTPPIIEGAVNFRGRIVPVVNVPGIKAGTLQLDGPTLASIYMGEIAKWNDARIKALNPKVALPDLAIAPVYRSDGSGTNFPSSS